MRSAGVPVAVIVAMIFAAVVVAAAPSAQALTCDAYGDYVVCDDGRTYVAPNAIGRYLALPQRPTPRVDARRATAPADPRVFRRAIDDFEDEARAVCLDRHRFDRGRRALCERQEVAARVNATNDDALIDWWAAGGAR